LGHLAAGAGAVVDGDPERFRHAKSVLKAIRQQFQEAAGENLQVIRVSDKIRSQFFTDIAKKLPA